MKRGWFVLLALSLGLNAGLLYRTLSAHDLSSSKESAQSFETPRETAPCGVPIECPAGGAPAGGVQVGAAGGPPADGMHPAPMAGGMPCDETPEVRALCGMLLRNRMQRMAEALDLDETQRAEARAILGEMLPRIVAERDRVRRIRDEVHDGYLQPLVDGAHVRALVAELAGAQARLDSLTAETILRESSILSAAQRTAYFRSMPWERCFPPGAACPPPGRRP